MSLETLVLDRDDHHVCGDPESRAEKEAKKKDEEDGEERGGGEDEDDKEVPAPRAPSWAQPDEMARCPMRLTT